MVVAIGTLVLGLILSWAGGTAFDPRYAAVVVPMLVVVVAVGFNVFASDRVRLGALARGAAPLSRRRRARCHERPHAGGGGRGRPSRPRPAPATSSSTAQTSSGPRRTASSATTADCIEVTYPSFGGPKRINWIDYRDRINATDPQEFADRVLELAGDASVWVVYAPGYRSFEQKCEGLSAHLGSVRPGTEVVANRFFPFYETMGLYKYGS